MHSLLILTSAASFQTVHCTLCGGSFVGSRSCLFVARVAFLDLRAERLDLSKVIKSTYSASSIKFYLLETSTGTGGEMFCTSRIYSTPMICVSRGRGPWPVRCSSTQSSPWDSSYTPSKNKQTVPIFHQQYKMMMVVCLP